MAISKNSLIYDILSILRSGKQTDDETITTRLISHWIDVSRAMIIRQQMNKGQSASNNILQTFCVDLAQVDASQCCDFETDCMILKSVNPIPKFIETNQGDLMTKVSPMGITNKAYPIIPMARAAFWGNSLFNKNKPCVFLDENDIYLFNSSDLIDKIVVTGVVESPEDLAIFNNCDDQPCYSNDDNYPISAHMWEIMKKLILDTNFRYMNMPADVNNNSTNDVTTNQAKN